MEQLHAIQGRREELYFQRAEHVHRARAIRLLLELLDGMAPPDRIEPPSNAEPVGACYNYDEFFRLTASTPPPGVFNYEGRMVAHHDDLVIRHVQKIEVLASGYATHFKMAD